MPGTKTVSGSETGEETALRSGSQSISQPSSLVDDFANPANEPFDFMDPDG
jgi:hypothetical protein